MAQQQFLATNWQSVQTLRLFAVPTLCIYRLCMYVYIYTHVCVCLWVFMCCIWKMMFDNKCICISIHYIHTYVCVRQSKCQAKQTSTNYWCFNVAFLLPKVGRTKRVELSLKIVISSFFQNGRKNNEKSPTSSSNGNIIMGVKPHPYHESSKSNGICKVNSPVAKATIFCAKICRWSTPF